MTNDMIGEEYMENSRNRVRVFGIIVIVSTILFVLKALIVTSISFSDESHQIATAYRFFLGDRPLVDDWSSEQLHGVAILPFISTYAILKKSTTGIVLFIRIIYLLIKFLVAVYGISKIRNSKSLAMYGILLWYFFSPYNIDSLTYQSMPLIALMFCLIVIKREESSLVEWGISGGLYAVSILSQPFWIISYPLILLDEIIKWKKSNKIEKYRIMMFQVGIGLIFLIFCVFLFSKTNLDELRINIPYILGEQDHNVSNMGIDTLIYNKVWLVFSQFVCDNKIVTSINVIYIIALIVFKEKREYLKVGMFISLAISLFSMLFLKKLFLMNEMMIPFLWLALENIFFVEESERKKYIKLIGLGILFSIATALGTNTGVYATSASLCLLACITLFYITISGTKKWNLHIETISMLFMVSMTLILRLYITWAGAHISMSDYMASLSYGPMKGLYTTTDLADEYEKIWTDITMLQPSGQDILFCGTSTPLAYLDAEVEYGTMGTPFFQLDYDRMRNYFALHKEKIPTIIYYTEFTEDDRSMTAYYKWLQENYDIYSDGVNLIARRKSGMIE